MELKQRVYQKVIERINGRINILYEGSSSSEESLRSVIQEQIRVKMMEERLSKLPI